MSGVAITASKSVQLSDWILLHHVVAAHEIGARFGGFPLLVAAGDHQHFLGLAQPVRHDHGAAHHLVGVLGVHAQAHVHFHGLVELGELDLLEQRNGLFERILAGFYLFPGGLILFTWLACHVSSLVQAVRPKRANEPPTERFQKGQSEFTTFGGVHATTR